MATRWRGTVRGVALGLAALGFIGCSVARINHLHSDANQKQMEKAVEAFSQTTSDRAGLGPTLLKNLETATALRRTVADARANVDDVDRATTLLSSTWLTMREKFLVDLGFRPSPGASDSLRFVRIAGKELDDRITRRVERIGAVIKILEALIAGDRALAAQAKVDVERAAKASPPKSAGASEPPSQMTSPSLVDLLVAFQRAVVESGRQAAKDESVRATATALEKALRDDAVKSRDPAAVYALVAVVGTGLEEESFRGLDAFLEFLDARLMKFTEQAEKACRGDGVKCSDEWQAFLEAAKAAAHLTMVGHLESLMERPGMSQADRLAKRLTELDKTRRFDVTSLSGRAAAEQFIAGLREKVKGPAILTNPKGTIGDLLTLTDKLSAEIDELRDQVESLPGSLESVLALLGPSTGGDSSKGSAGTDLIQQALASNPKLAAQFGGAIKEDDLRQLAAIIADIGKERAAASQRIADYLKTLHRVQLDLHEENLRHDQAIVAVAAQEIRRWNVLREIDRFTSPVFEDARACDAEAPRPEPVLFATTDHVKCWNAWYTRVRPREELKGGAHPLVDLQDRVVPTVRRLAETANLWQRASPNVHDPLGFDTSTSNHRLWQGVQLLNAHLLMQSLNERYAFDNRIRLSTEVAEHRLHLDGIAARAEEAGLNLALGDVAAFHASGITQADLQTFFSAVQSVLLAVIGGKI